MSDTLHFIESSFWASPQDVLIFTGGIFAIVYARYLLMSAGYHFVVSRVFRHSKRKFVRPGKPQWKREILWSAASTAVFTFLTLLTVWLYQNGWTRIYSDPHEYGLSYFFVSIMILLVGYETYYYWLHRWMHLPAIYKRIHKVHHASINTSVFTSFSFHPAEAALQFVFLPLMTMLIPFHYAAIGSVLLLMTISAIINHGSVEIFPKFLLFRVPGKFLIGATHHDLHHKEFKTNFGLYLTFWDRWMKTESKNLPARIDEIIREKPF